MLNRGQLIGPRAPTTVEHPIFLAPDLELDVDPAVLCCGAWMSFDKVGHLILLVADPAWPMNKDIPILVVSEDQSESKLCVQENARHTPTARSSSSESGWPLKTSVPQCPSLSGGIFFAFCSTAAPPPTGSFM